MKRLLLDTNIYGEMVVDKNLSLILKCYKEKKNLIIYGFSVVRKELRDTPKTKLFFGKNLRVALLSLYDQCVKEHSLDIDENRLYLIAKEYYQKYRTLGGAKSFDILEKDYLVVACASHKDMDIVVSNDDSSMLSELSLKAYAIVNQSLKLRTPDFLDYDHFKDLLFEGA